MKISLNVQNFTSTHQLFKVLDGVHRNMFSILLTFK